MDVSADRSPKRRRISGLVQTVAFVAVLLLGIVALNWPITFAQEPTNPSGSSSSQTLLAPDDDSSSTTDPTVADVADKANPAVVTITNYRNPIDPYTGEEESGNPIAYGVGSGYIIDEAGQLSSASSPVRLHLRANGWVTRERSSPVVLVRPPKRWLLSPPQVSPSRTARRRFRGW